MTFNLAKRGCLDAIREALKGGVSLSKREITERIPEYGYTSVHNSLSQAVYRGDITCTGAKGRTGGKYSIPKADTGTLPTRYHPSITPLKNYTDTLLSHAQLNKR